MENIQTKELRYKKAFKEIYLIINDLAEELYSKIPKGFIELIKNNMDLEYNISLEQIEKDEIMDETKAIMALIYRDYFCDKDTRKKLLKQEEQELKIENEKYNDIFKNKQINNKNEQTFNKLSGIKEEKWYIKIWNKIRVYCNKLRK